MTEEQKKVRKFYKELQGWKPECIGTWIGAGFLVMFMLIGCAIPAQEMFAGVSGDVDTFGWIMVLMFGPLAGFLYLRPYTSVTEMVYTNQAKKVRIIDKLQYLPIDLKEIRKMKITYLLKFYAKIAPFCMLLQVLTSLYSYQEVTWVNVVYVLVMAFVWPVAVNLPAIISESAVDISVPSIFVKYGKWIVVILIFLGVVAYLFFPRNVKSLFLKGAEEDTVVIKVSDVSGEERKVYNLTEEQTEQILALWEKSYVRINLFHKSFITEHFMGYYIYMPGNEGWLYFFSEDIISIEGQQYCIYGDGMAEAFREIIE